MNNLDKEVKNINLKNEENHFFHLYKNENKINTYKEKMKREIDEIRSKQRQNDFDLTRALNETEDDERAIRNCFYRKATCNRNKWANLMMLAEWIVVLPDDFHSDFCMKFCPFGKHVLLVSQRNKTMIYNKNGTMIKCFESSLPGGGLDETGHCPGQRHAVFDCIFDESGGKIYFLDIIFYLRQDFREMSAEDRFNWLENYCQSTLSNIESSNNYKFDTLSAFECSRGSLNTVFSSKAPFPIDGLLFYMKMATYVSGSTYCTMWMKPFMVPELLSFTVHSDFMANVPMDYDGYREEIIRYNKQFGWKPLSDKQKDKIDEKDKIDGQDKKMDL